MRQLYIVVSCPFLSFSLLFGGEFVKKRLISFFMALMFLVSFPVSASAVSVIGIINGFLTAFEFAQVFIKMDRQDIVNPLSDADFQALRDNYLNSQKQAASQSAPTSWSGSGSLIYDYIDNRGALSTDDSIPVEISAYIEFVRRYYGVTLPEDFKYVIWADPNNNNLVTLWLFYNFTEDYPIYDPVYNGSQLSVSCSYSGGYHSCTFLSAQFTHTFKSDLGVYMVSLANMSKIPNCTNRFTTSNAVLSYDNFSTNFTEEPILFTSSITLDRTERGGQSHLWLNITLDSSKIIEHDVIALGGVLYDDGTNRGFVNADYVDGKSLQGGNHWEWKYDMNGFSGWAYRKHLGLDNFYGFVSVEGDAGGTHMTNVVYANEKPLNLPPPDFGPFADVQELPDYDDYKPTPSPYPTLPEVTFNFTPNNNYTTYNYDTVNNYDSTQNFNEWLGDTITTINNNVSGGIDSIDNNLRIIGDNINDFSTSVKNYIEGGGASVNEYIGNLIIKFDDDFLSWTDSFGDYLGDVLDTINFNIQIISDNVLNFFKIQLVPDEDYLNLLLMECCPWYFQIRDLFGSASSSSSSFSLYLPGLDYTYVLSDGELVSQLRSVLTYCLYAFTVISCVRIGFQIFGIHIFPGGDDT